MVTSEQLPRSVTRDPRCVITDDRGSYTLAELYAADYVLGAVVKPYRPATYRPDPTTDDETFALHPGEYRTGVDIMLQERGVPLTGTVSDLTGGPVAHALVRAEGAFAAVETDSDGRYELWVAAGDVAVSATADGYASGDGDGVAPGTVDIWLLPEATFAGTVVDAKSNAPVEGAVVDALWNDRYSPMEIGRSEVTDEHGHFSIDRLPPGRYSAVAHAPHGYGRIDGSVFVGLGQHVDGGLLRLWPAVTVAGRVVVAGTPPTPCRRPDLTLHSPGRETLHARGDADGSVRVDHVLPGKYDATAECDGFLSPNAPTRIEVADHDIIGHTWEVTNGATLRGRVLTRAGAPVEHAHVSTTDESSVDTKPDGSYEFKGLKPGTRQIEVISNAGVQPNQGWTVDLVGTAVVEKDLVLDNGGVLKGKLVDADGKPIAGARVVARSASRKDCPASECEHASPVGADGTFVLEGMRSDDYFVSAHLGAEWLEKPGATPKDEPTKVAVRAGQTSTLRLVVEALSGSIKGQVIDVTGKPVTDAFIAVADDIEAAHWAYSTQPVVTGVDGTFVVGKLSRGKKYAVRAYRSGGGEALAENVAVGSSVTLQIKPTASIEGTVRRQGGPPEELAVELANNKTGFTRVERFFRTSGRYAVRDLPAGTYRVVFISHPQLTEQTVDLANGEHKTGFDVDLGGVITVTGRMVDLVTRQPVADIEVVAELYHSPMLVEGRMDRRNSVTDASGTFSIPGVPRGQLWFAAYPKDGSTSPYDRVLGVRREPPSDVLDLGDVLIAKRRTKDGDTPIGRLGVQWSKHDGQLDDPCRISSIDPGSGAAKAGLQVGDAVVSVDGTDVTGVSCWSVVPLTYAAVGTSIAFGLAGGRTVSVVLGP